MTHGELNRLAVLAALNETSTHGYALHAQIENGRGWYINTGGTYRLLRNLDKDSLVKSSWNMPEQGPAQRIYSITPAGRDYLISERKVLHDHVLQVKRLLDQIPRS